MGVANLGVDRIFGWNKNFDPSFPTITIKEFPLEIEGNGILREKKIPQNRATIALSSPYRFFDNNLIYRSCYCRIYVNNLTVAYSVTTKL